MLSIGSVALLALKSLWGNLCMEHRVRPFSGDGVWTWKSSKLPSNNQTASGAIPIYAGAPKYGRMGARIVAVTSVECTGSEL